MPHPMTNLSPSMHSFTYSLAGSKAMNRHREKLEIKNKHAMEIFKKNAVPMLKEVTENINPRQKQHCHKLVMSTRMKNQFMHNYR